MNPTVNTKNNTTCCHQTDSLSSLRWKHKQKESEWRSAPSFFVPQTEGTQAVFSEAADGRHFTSLTGSVLNVKWYLLTQPSQSKLTHIHQLWERQTHVTVSSVSSLRVVTQKDKNIQPASQVTGDTVMMTSEHLFWPMLMQLINWECLRYNKLN